MAQLLGTILDVAGEDAEKVRQELLKRPTVDGSASDDAWDRGEDLMPPDEHGAEEATTARRLAVEINRRWSVHTTEAEAEELLARIGVLP
jgi:hypothetical protein